MAHLPIVIYSPRHDPVGLAFMFKGLGCDVSIIGNPNSWSELRLQGPKKFLRRRAKLIIRYDASLCEGPEWPLHVAGLVGYFGQFPDGPFKAPLLMYLQSCRFGFSMAEAELDLQSDERADWVYAICSHLGGVLMTPVMLLDAAGRILLSHDGTIDSNAELPDLPPRLDDEEDQNGEDESCPPPIAGRVAARTMVLAAVVERGMIENEYTSASDAEQARAELIAWLNAVDVIDEAEPEERALLGCPFGQLPQQQMIDAIWRIEGLAVLLWSLGLFHLPPYHELVNPHEVWNAVAIFDEERALRILHQAQLRSPKELANYHTHITMAHWRLRNQQLHPGPVDFVAMSRGCWIGTFDLGEFQVIDSDLALGDQPIGKIDEARLSNCQRIANERHLAANWLIGWNSSVYSETDTST